MLKKIKNAEIFYTSDGSQPNQGSFRYTGPMTVNHFTSPIMVTAYLRTDFCESYLGPLSYTIKPPTDTGKKTRTTMIPIYRI